MKEKIKDVMRRVFHLDTIGDDFSQRDCAKWDSLNHLNLVVELEEAFDVSFEPEEIAEMKSLDAIENLLNQKA